MPSEKDGPESGCWAPSWCGTDCLGTNGPGLTAKRGADYVVGMGTELFCSTACRNEKWPSLACYPADYSRDTHEWVGPDVVRRLQPPPSGGG